jgi:Na+/proline symporter
VTAHATALLPMTLTPLDWLIIIVYLAGCMVAGLWMRRYVRGVEEFAVAGREMDVNLGIASLAATELGLVTIMYTAQLGFEKGLAGATIGVIMASCLLARRPHRLHHRTAARRRRDDHPRAL